MSDKLSKNKIYSLNELSIITKKLKTNKKKIVLCHGVFDLLHIGHIKHFQEAKKNGDILIVSITADEFVHKGPNRPYFNTYLRLEALASISLIDYVTISNDLSAVNIIKKIMPNIYFKGDEYKIDNRDVTGMIQKEKNAIKSVGGKIKFSEEITFSSSTILNKYGKGLTLAQKSLINKLKKNFLSLK